MYEGHVRVSQDVSVDTPAGDEETPHSGTFSAVASGSQAHGGEEGLAEGRCRGLRLQALPLRAGGGEGQPAQRGGQPGHRHEVGGAPRGGAEGAWPQSR